MTRTAESDKDADSSSFARSRPAAAVIATVRETERPLTSGKVCRHLLGGVTPARESTFGCFTGHSAAGRIEFRLYWQTNPQSVPQRVPFETIGKTLQLQPFFHANATEEFKDLKPVFGRSSKRREAAELYQQEKSAAQLPNVEVVIHQRNEQLDSSNDDDEGLFLDTIGRSL
ncbi:hypothetical protein BV898_02169 [Hypsibius exemplaris]|uniref:Uncharacterized protein n=1 Tax=Hypsibius exemplaris TaxID=2072580 RepID=A0A1W0X8H5_HYPEX|nr:hypothetical protein BV898_02169 [Hypsibius exemplaris]